MCVCVCACVCLCICILAYVSSGERLEGLGYPWRWKPWPSRVSLGAELQLLPQLQALVWIQHKIFRGEITVGLTSDRASVAVSDCGCIVHSLPLFALKINKPSPGASRLTLMCELDFIWWGEGTRGHSNKHSTFPLSKKGKKCPMWPHWGHVWSSSEMLVFLSTEDTYDRRVWRAWSRTFLHSHPQLP